MGQLRGEHLAQTGLLFNMMGEEVAIECIKVVSKVGSTSIDNQSHSHVLKLHIIPSPLSIRLWHSALYGSTVVALYIHLQPV